jgi:hypothetical protein
MPFYEKILRDFRKGRGSAGLEAAIAMPLMMTMLAFVIVYAIGGWEILMSAAGTPIVTRAAGAEHGNAAAAYAVLPRPARGMRVQYGASGCARAVQSRLSVSDSQRVPLINALVVPLRGGSYTRRWRFWAGPPDDGCF